MTKTELIRRQSGIGASEIPDLMGLGFNDAMTIYLRKTLEVIDDNKPKGDLLAGLMCEPIIAKMYWDRFPERQLFGCDFTRHPQRDWQFCTPDFFHSVQGQKTGYVQAKAPRYYGDDWGDDGSSEIPDNYIVQVHQEMGVLGIEEIEVAALCRTAWELRVFRIPFSPELFRLITEVGAEAWSKIQQRIPLDDGWEQRWRPEAKKLIIRPGTVILGPDVAKLIERRRVYGEIKDEAEAEYRSLTAEIGKHLGEDEIGIAGVWKVKRILVEAGIVEAHTRKAYTKIDIRPLPKSRKD